MATIQELESFKLSDAVVFHDELNPNLWNNNILDPEVRQQLLLIAEDFVEYLGISNLKVKDVTISGSNAAFSYTPHSDLDLHVLVDFSELPDNEVYQELFTAKKTLYNDAHSIKVHDVPVELYVQDTNQPVTSLGEYSIVHDKWIRIPKKQKANFDEAATKAKYEKLGDLIELALNTHDPKRVKDTISIVKRYRKSGLDKHGEFGPENLAYKAVRKQGLVKALYDLNASIHGQKLSIEEDHTLLNKPTLSIAEIAAKHGVSRMQIARQLDKGIKVELEHTTDRSVAREIALDHLSEDPKYYDKLAKVELESTTALRSMYMHEGILYSKNLLLEQQLYEDFLGSAKQLLGNRFNETMANIKGQVNDTINAGIIIKDIASNPQLMTNVTSQIRKWTSQLVKNITSTIQTAGQQLNVPQLADKLATVWKFISSKVAEFGISPGWKGFLGSLGIYGFVKFISEMLRNIPTLKSTITSGALDALAGKAKELATSIIGNITMPGFLGIFDKLSTVKQYFFDVLNQVKTKFGAVAVAGTPQFSKGVQLEASGYIPSVKQRNDPRWCTALTVDIKPDAIKKNAKAFGFKTSRAGIPPQARADGKIAESLMNEWKSFLAEDEQSIKRIHMINQEFDGASLDGYVVDTDQVQLGNYLESQGANPAIAKKLAQQYNRIGIIKNMWVDEEERNQGLGTDLVSNAIDDAYLNGAEAVVLVSDEGESNEFNLTKWYESFGFKKIGMAGTDPIMLLTKSLSEADEQQGELFPGYDKEHREKRLDNWLKSTHAWDGHKPITFYHATTKDFNTFNTHGTGFASALGMAFEVERHGSFFAVDPKFAETFIEDPNTREYKPGGRVIPVHLSVQNPIDLRDISLSHMLSNEDTVEGFKANDIDLRSIYYHVYQDDRWVLFDGPEGGEFVENLQKLGFDGAIINEAIPNDSNARSGEVWVVFNPNQVKSIHNRGSFSPDDPSLMKESIMEGRSEDLFNKYGGRMMEFNQLPKSAKDSLIHYMTVEGDSPDFADEMLFGYVIVPMDVLTQVVMSAPDNDFDEFAGDFDAYHTKYWKGEDDSEYANHLKEMWPVILDDNEGIWDGWHRLHWYYRNGVKNVPAILIAQNG